MPRPVHALLLLAACVAAPPGLSATGEPWSLTVRAENDLPANADRYYSNGVSLAFARCVAEADAFWPQVLAVPGLDRPGVLSQGFDLGQIMVTPADIQRPVPDPNDRPYAGLLYVAATWQRFDESDYAALKLITGVIGPPSLAEQTQKAIHRLIDSPLPQGWDHQLRTEPILNVVYERRTRLGRWGDGRGWTADALGVAGGTLGNILTQAYAQAQLRAGWRTPQDFGTSLIRGIGALPPARNAGPWGAHAFVGAGGFAVAHNATLDGSLFRSGPGVGHRTWVPAAEAGLVLRGRGWQLTASWVVWGREFDAQLQHAEFGTLALAVFR